MPQAQEWLKHAGYDHYCFISWPHTSNEQLSECAARFNSAIKNRLSDSIHEPSVFFDNGTLSVGDKWPEKLQRALCRSVTMLAICAPIYYHPKHPWCGLEWAAMDQLNKRRLPKEEFHSIIPVVVRRDVLPDAVSRLQYLDISGVYTSSKAYFNTNDFRSTLSKIVQQIERTAEAIATLGAKAECEQFKFPKKSPFPEYSITPQPFFRKTR